MSSSHATHQTSKDGEWITAAYLVLNTKSAPMHVSEIENVIKIQELVSSTSPSLPLEVLLTKEAAMGRRFTKADGPTPGYFSLLPANTTAATIQQLASLSPGRASTTSLVSPTIPVANDEMALNPNLKYQIRYKQLKKTCKQMVYLNAALYDEISRIQKKIEKATNERKTLLLKLMADQNITNPKAQQGETKAAKHKTEKDKTESGTKKIKTEASDSKNGKAKSPEPLAITTKPLSKKQKNAAKRAIHIPPISLDSNGRPVLPLELPAGLTIYSLGEINDRPGYCRSECIYPVGYCCTREFGSIKNLMKTCLFTCKVSEGTTGPKFEISPDDEPSKTFQDTTPEGCHNKLVNYLRKCSGKMLEMTQASDFFGLKHPVIKNLLQCSPGAQSCLEYSWCKFEVVRSASKASEVASETDPCTSYEALGKLLGFDKGNATPSSSDDEDEDD